MAAGGRRRRRHGRAAPRQCISPSNWAPSDYIGPPRHQTRGTGLGQKLWCPPVVGSRWCSCVGGHAFSSRLWKRQGAAASILRTFRPDRASLFSLCQVRHVGSRVTVERQKGVGEKYTPMWDRRDGNPVQLLAVAVAGRRAPLGLCGWAIAAGGRPLGLWPFMGDKLAELRDEKGAAGILPAPACASASPTDDDGHPAHHVPLDRVSTSSSRRRPIDPSHGRDEQRANLGPPRA
jgi:hypothetical protein